MTSSISQLEAYASLREGITHFETAYGFRNYRAAVAAAKDLLNKRIPSFENEFPQNIRNQLTYGNSEYIGNLKKRANAVLEGKISLR